MNARLLSVYAQIEACKAQIEQMKAANDAAKARHDSLMPFGPDEFKCEAAYLGRLSEDALSIGDTL